MTAPPILIVGGGLSGLFAALKLQPLPVTVLATAPIGEGASSAWAQGGIAAALGPGDTVEKHVADTLAAGAGIVDEAAARVIAGEAADRIHDLLDYGVPFDRDLAGKLTLSREAAHSERRVVHVAGDQAGRAIMAAVVAAVRRSPWIEVVEGYSGEEILRDPNGAAIGIAARARKSGKLRAFAARAVVLATGGIGSLYAVTTNPPEANGSGLGMAARAGALVADPEFVQFHPTALDVGRDPAPLATEALRGEGALLIDRAGRRFMPDVDPAAELAPRDIVARAVHRQIQSGRGAFLDCRPLGREIAEKFPAVADAARAAGLDPANDPLPVAPAAHYHMGGVAVDLQGRSSLPGLWAVGEVASTGAHGANRLASNSLLEAVVFAARAAADIKAAGLAATERPLPDLADDNGAPAAPEATLRLRRAMSADVGVVRDAAGLTRALATIAALAAGTASRSFRNRLAAGKLVAAAALARTESRGGHYRSDFPEREPDTWRHRTFLRLAEIGGLPEAISSAPKRA
ncbi:MAG: L-aspartate oxidase [Bauldia sp.]